MPRWFQFTTILCECFAALKRVANVFFDARALQKERELSASSSEASNEHSQM
jgi:hypothetical protein